MPRQPQPVPPIFQPEVAADAIHWAAHHDRREWSVGFPTVKAIVGNKFVPGLADLYLARNGYESQMHDGETGPNRPDNLYEPPPGDYGAHGQFDARAKNFSWQFWLNKHRSKVALAGGCLAGIGAATLLAGRRD
jgi:hypothetical protein